MEPSSILQEAYRFDWGSPGVRAVGPGAAVIIVVDVLSHSTAVDLTTSTGGSVQAMAIEADAAEVPDATVLSACLRNAPAVAAWARRLAGPKGAIAVIAAGDRWSDGGVRFAVEDLIGAGAVLMELDPSSAVNAPRCSPEAAAARASFIGTRYRLVESIARSRTGQAIIERGWTDDIGIAAAYGVSRTVPILRNGAFLAG